MAAKKLISKYIKKISQKNFQKKIQNRKKISNFKSVLKKFEIFAKKISFIEKSFHTQKPDG